MKKFYIEGVFYTPAARRKARRSAEVQPFSRVYWAESAQQALQQAREDNPGVQWVEGPRLVSQSEEERMRQAGAPELFKLSEMKKPKQRRKTQ